MFLHKIFHWQTSTEMSTVFISQWRDLSRGVMKDLLRVFFLMEWIFSPLGLWMKDFPISRYLCGERNDNPLQYSCQDDPMDRRAWGLQSMGHKESDTTELLSTHRYLWDERFANGDHQWSNASGIFGNKKVVEVFPHGPVVKNLSCNAEDTGSLIRELRPHMLQSD